MAKASWFARYIAGGEQNIVSLMITPDMAIEALAGNTNNRRLMPRRVNRFVDEILNGRWLESGNTIKFATTGELIDGQHRLHAIIKAGVAVRLNVAFGLDPHAKIVVDEIQPRKISENIHIAGYQNTNTLAALGKLAIPYFDLGHNPFSYRGNRTFSTGEVLEWIEDNPDSIQAANSGVTLKPIMPGSIGAFCLLVFRRRDAELAENWRHKMITGADIAEGSPWNLLRKRLESDRASRKKESQEYTCALCFLAWNAVRKNRRLGVLRYVPDEDRSKFPVAE